MGRAPRAAAVAPRPPRAPRARGRGRAADHDRGAGTVRRLSVAVLAAVLSGACGPTAKPPASPRPATPAPRSGNGLSVLLITIDTLRADHLGVYGYGRRTSPHI